MIRNLVLLSCLLLAGCPQPQGSGVDAFGGMIQCRKAFDASLEALADAAKRGLGPQQKLEVVMEAVTRRNHCEARVIEKAKAALGK